MPDERVPTTAEELVPVIQQEFEDVTKQACAAAGTCVPWPDSTTDVQGFDAMVELFGRRLAEALAARPRPLVCDPWTVVVDVRRVASADVPKIDQLKLTLKAVIDEPGNRPTLLFLPVLVHQGDEVTGIELMRSKYGGVGELAASVSIVLGLDCIANTRIVAVTRTSPRGSARWWSWGPMAANRTAKLGQWANTDPPTPAGTPQAVRVTSVGSSMLN